MVILEDQSSRYVDGLVVMVKVVIRISLLLMLRVMVDSSSRGMLSFVDDHFKVKNEEG